MFALRPLKELAFPLDLSLLLIIAAILFLRRDRKRLALRLLVGATIILLTAACPILSGRIVQMLEAAYPSRPLTEYPTASAIVVLGGSVSRKTPSHGEIEEVRGGRMIPTFQLFQLKKAPLIIVSGGNPYTMDGETRTEAHDMRDYLKQLGVPESAILMENQSRNTAEEAVEVAKLANARRLKSLLLVTSAFHQRRAMGLFQNQNLNVIAVPAGHLNVATVPGLHNFVPSAASLQNTTVAINELLGLLWYRLTGKI